MQYRIYLDNNATTALDPRVLDSMMLELTAPPYNASSVHAYGQEARNLLTKARRRVADMLGVWTQEIIFTSGGTESMNLAIRGVLAEGRGHVVTSAIEHSCVLNTLEQISGIEVTYLKPGQYGAVTAQQIEQALRPQTRLIVLMAANNETGVLTDIEAIGHLADRAGIPLIVDGTAWIGKAPFSWPTGVSALGISGHKIHGPKGIGMLIVRKSLRIRPQITGGSQQYELRGGTENLAGILGLTTALELIESHPLTSIQGLRDRLESGLRSVYPRTFVNGEGPRVVNTTNLCFEGLDGESLLMGFDLAGICVSHGSACSSGSLEPSHVLLGMDYDPKRARSSLRFSLSRQTTKEEIEEVLARSVQILAK